jgi:NADPH:quinone reductase-like Zn-dependent oxidoreductase
MKAVTFDSFGSPDVLRITDLPDPVPGPGEVVVAVCAATINPTDLMMLGGQQARLMTHLSPPFIAGMEFSGHVLRAGPRVALVPGQAVIGVVNPRRPQGGAQAQRICVPAVSVAPVAASGDLAAAATVPMNALTGMLALEFLALPPGSSLLVTGGAGQLGNLVIQLAQEAGLKVLANAAEQDRALLLELGAVTVLPRDAGLEPALRQICPQGVDGLVDGALIGAQVSHLVRDGGRAVSLRSSHPIADARLTSGYVSVVAAMEDQARIARIADLLQGGVLSPRVAPQGVFPFTQAAEAFRMAAQGGFRGRVILTFDNDQEGRNHG